MRRVLVTSMGAMALALLPAALFAQTPPPAQPPAAQQPAAAAAPPAQPTAPKVGFATPSGVLIVTIKPDQIATFEELIKKLRAGLAKSEDATLKQQATGLKAYKASEPGAAGAVLYVLMMEPTVPNAEYDLFTMLSKTMTVDEQRAPETAEMWKRFSAAFGGPLSRLSLTPVPQ